MWGFCVGGWMDGYMGGWVDICTNVHGWVDSWVGG